MRRLCTQILRDRSELLWRGFQLVPTDRKSRAGEPVNGLFAVARAFGGPIYWRAGGESVTGTDRYHYQDGLGTAYSLGAAHLFAEGIPLGEQAVTVGGGAAF